MKKKPRMTPEELAAREARHKDIVRRPEEIDRALPEAERRARRWRIALGDRDAARGEEHRPEHLRPRAQLAPDDVHAVAGRGSHRRRDRLADAVEEKMTHGRQRP